MVVYLRQDILNGVWSDRISWILERLRTCKTTDHVFRHRIEALGIEKCFQTHLLTTKHGLFWAIDQLRKVLFYIKFILKIVSSNSRLISLHYSELFRSYAELDGSRDSLAVADKHYFHSIVFPSWNAVFCRVMWTFARCIFLAPILTEWGEIAKTPHKYAYLCRR